MVKKVGIVIQARTGSTRLPGKILLDIMGKPMLLHIYERLQQCKEVDNIIIATTIGKNDDLVAKLANDNNIKYFRGSEDNVLERYYMAAKEYSLDIVIRITADCPVIDPIIIDEMVRIFKRKDYTVVSNAGYETFRTFPRGLDAEIFKFSILEEAYNNATETYEKEHVTPYLYDNYKNIYYYKSKNNNAEFRWTVDTKEDFKLITEIYKNLYTGKHNFYYDDIIELMLKKPELKEINKDIKQKKIDRK